MTDFASADSYWRFQQTVKHKTRYFHDGQVRNFLNTVLETSRSRKESIRKFSVLFRAQRGYTWRKDNEGQPEEMEVPAAFPPERMKPLAEFVGDSRVNPKGIPCLYLASSLDTAIAEVRPWVGSTISLAQFVIRRDLVVVDCWRDKRRLPLWLVDGEPKEMPPQEREAECMGRDLL
jgi:hypothetical protein